MQRTEHLDDGISLFTALVELGVRVTGAMAAVVTHPDVLSNATTRILIELHRHGTRQPRQLAVSLGVSRPQITKLLTELENEHLIHRQSGVAPDRRLTIVTLTPTGQQVIDAADNMLRHGFDDLASVTRTIEAFLERTALTNNTPSPVASVTGSPR